MIKIDVISGFLGAGKTTLIKKLFESKKFKSEKIVIIENEFGEIGIDGAFLKDSGVQIKEINAGCICCSLVGDFESSIKELVATYSPDRIIIEPSGVGKLSDIIGAINKVQGLDLEINILATVVDAAKTKIYLKNFGEFFNNQVKAADTIVVGKVDKVNEDKLQEAVNAIKAVNPNANIITTAISDLDGDKIVMFLEEKASLREELLAQLQKEHEEESEHHHHHHHYDENGVCSCGHHHDDDDDDDDEEEHEHHHHHDDDDEEEEHEHHHHHHDDDDEDEPFRNLVLYPEYRFTKEELEEIFTKIPEDIIRIKGYVLGEEETYYFNYVLNEYHIFTGEEREKALVSIIGTEIDHDYFKELFHD